MVGRPVTVACRPGAPDASSDPQCERSNRRTPRALPTHSFYLPREKGAQRHCTRPCLATTCLVMLCSEQTTPVGALYSTDKGAPRCLALGSLAVWQSGPEGPPGPPGPVGWSCRFPLRFSSRYSHRGKRQPCWCWLALRLALKRHGLACGLFSIRCSRSLLSARVPTYDGTYTTAGWADGRGDGHTHPVGTAWDGSSLAFHCAAERSSHP